MKLVLAGDLHLGRTSSRLPDAWRDEARTLSGWDRLVEATLREQADALLLSGDLIDASNRFFETLGALEAGIRTLADAGIRTLAVCGNHDAEVLPRLATRLPPTSFRLLGAGGQWERLRLDSPDGSLWICGWSFPSPRVSRDPTLDFPATAADGLPTLAMVHGDPGQPDSPYAPLSLPRLQSLPVAGWLLGHIHRPRLEAGTPWVLMPGSPQPLDPGEPGPHHAWICELRNGQLELPRPFFPSTLQYRPLDVEVGPADPASEEWVIAQLERLLAAAPFEGRQALRVRLHGTHPDPERFEEALRHLIDWSPPGLAVESVESALHPSLDLDRIAEAGPVQALLIEALRQPPPALRRRWEEIRESLRHQTEFAGKGLPPPEEEGAELTAALERVLREVCREAP
jgi:DNA repair exonuclease SbcCD nuclease subunit